MDNLPDHHKGRLVGRPQPQHLRNRAWHPSCHTVLSRLNSFIDSEQEQVLCFDSPIDAEHFATEKSAIFLIIPEEDPTKNFMAGL